MLEIVCQRSHSSDQLINLPRALQITGSLGAIAKIDQTLFKLSQTARGDHVSGGLTTKRKSER